MMSSSAMTGNDSHSCSQLGDIRNQPVTSGYGGPTGGDAFMQCSHEMRKHNSNNNSNSDEYIYVNLSHLFMEDK